MMGLMVVMMVVMMVVVVMRNMMFNTYRGWTLVQSLFQALDLDYLVISPPAECQEAAEGTNPQGWGY